MKSPSSIPNRVNPEDPDPGGTAEHLQEQKEFLSAIFHNAPFIMLVVTSEYRVREINQFGAEAIQHDLVKLINLKFGEALCCEHRNDSPQSCGFGAACKHCLLRETIRESFRTGKSSTGIELAFNQRNDGKEAKPLFFSLSTTPIQVKGEKLMLVALEDITRRKKAEADKKTLQKHLFEVQKMESVGRLAGGIAHEFNNKLTASMGFIELCLTDNTLDPLIREWLESALKVSQSSADLVRQLLAYAQKQFIVPRKMDINQAIANMLQMLDHLLGPKIELIWRPASESGILEIDPGQIEQIMLNLCINSRDAVNGNGQIVIETATVNIEPSANADLSEINPGPYVMISVTDTGAGIKPEIQEKIFEPFFTTKEVGKGTGLGLSTVDGIVKQNEGFITLNSTEGNGAAFRIYLPQVQKPPEADKSENQAGPLPSGRETLLLVDDEPAIRKTLGLCLKRLGYEVLTADSFDEAARLVEEHSDPIHLLITDVIMPHRKAAGLADHLLEVNPSMQVLYMSAYPSEGIASQGISAQQVNFIEKPIPLDTLAQKLRTILDAS